MILKEGMNVRVVLFPEGEDPDSYAKNHSTEELKAYITKNAQDFIRFKTAVLIKEVGNDPIKKAELIKDIVASIAIIPDQIKRSVYTKECSSLLDISEQALINETNKILRGNATKKTTSSEPEEFPDFYDIDGKQDEQEAGTDIAHWEADIIRLLISYGDQTILVESENETGEKNVEEVVTAVYIISNINADNILFEKPLYQEVCDFYIEKLNKEELPTHQDFINHTNQDISQLTINILSIQHELSPNWETHKIFTTTEEQQLKLAVYNTVYAFKLSKLNKLIGENQEQLKTANDDKQLELLHEQVNLQQVKKQLAHKLGRIILK